MNYYNFAFCKSREEIKAFFMRISIKLPLIIGLIVFVAVLSVTVFSIFIFRENAMERIADIQKDEIAKRETQMKNFVNTSIDFLEFARHINEGNETNKLQNNDENVVVFDDASLSSEEAKNTEIKIDFTNLTQSAIKFINDSYNKDNLQFWILKNKPPYEIRFSTYMADIYNSRMHTIKNSEYDRVAGLVDLCARVGEGFEEYTAENVYGNKVRKIVYVKQYTKRAWVLGVEHNLSEIDALIEARIKSLNAATLRLVYRSLLLSMILVALATMLIYLQLISITRIIKILRNQVTNIVEGKLMEKTDIVRSDEMGEMAVALNRFSDTVGGYIRFSEELNKGNLEYKYELDSNNDLIGSAFIKVQQTLIQSQIEERKRMEENKLNEWVNNGVSKFNDILRRRNDKIEELSDTILSFLIKYLNANQGGVFILNEGTETPRLELIASYAYNRKKFLEKHIEIGENLLGACVLEKTTINIGNLPDNYVEISSGLGGANPTNLLLVPLISDNNVLGVVEMASFDLFAKHHIEFVERIAENMASTLGALRINTQTQKLLEKSRQQAEEMETKEQELIQSIEELRKIHEDSKLKESEINSLLKAVNSLYSIFKFNLKGYLLEINTVACKLLDVKRKEVLDKHFDEILPSTLMDANERMDFWDDLRMGETKQKTRFIFINNKELWFEEFYAPIYNREGVPVAIVCIAADLSKIKSLEKENKILRKEIQKQRIR